MTARHMQGDNKPSIGKGRDIPPRPFPSGSNVKRAVIKGDFAA